MRLHNITITPRGVTIDGVPLIVREDGPRVEQVDPAYPLSIVYLPVIARTVTVAGDTHDPDEPTPVYDKLLRSAIASNINTRCGAEKHPADWRTWSNK